MSAHLAAQALPVGVPAMVRSFSWGANNPSISVNYRPMDEAHADIRLRRVVDSSVESQPAPVNTEAHADIRLRRVVG
jgi:hypothetical protein